MDKRDDKHLSFDVCEDAVENVIQSLIDVVCAMGELAAKHNNLVSAVFRQ